MAKSSSKCQHKYQPTELKTLTKPKAKEAKKGEEKKRREKINERRKEVKKKARYIIITLIKIWDKGKF